MTEDRLLDKLRKILALTGSPAEGEAQAAAEHLQRLLTAHNLSMADLEKKGAKAPRVHEQGHDLGKAAFKWKLDLADAVAEFYFCVPLVNRQLKTVAFVGRPDNVESLQMLYAWTIEQIAAIAREERRNHFVRTNEHVDPLRWQVNFGIGAVQRLRTRLAELKQRQSAEVETQALVAHHAAEISDYLEEHYGYRTDGRMTKAQREADERWEEYIRKRAQEAEEKAALLATDPDEYYRQYPYEHPDAVAEQEKRDEKRRKRDERNAARRTGRSPRPMSAEAEKRAEQAHYALAAGRRRADDVNLQPFLNGDDPARKKVS